MLWGLKLLHTRISDVNQKELKVEQAATLVGMCKNCHSITLFALMSVLVVAGMWCLSKCARLVISLRQNAIP